MEKTVRRKSKRLSSGDATASVKVEEPATKRRRSKRLSADKEKVAVVAMTVKKTKNNVKNARSTLKTPKRRARKVPDFKKMHQKMFAKQEKLVEFGRKTKGTCRCSYKLKLL